MIGSTQAETEKVCWIIDDFSSRISRAKLAVFPVSVRRVIAAREGSGHVLIASTDRCFFSDSPVASGTGLNPDGQFFGRGFRDDIDHSTDGVIAEKNTSSASDNFDSFDLVQGYLRPIDAAEIDFVNPSPINEHQGVGWCRLSESAKVDLYVFSIPIQVPHNDALFRSQQIGSGPCVGVFDLLCGNDRHVRWNLPDLLFLSCRCHNNLSKDRYLVPLIGEDRVWGQPES